MQTQPTLTTKDKARLKTQAQRIFAVMSDGTYWSLYRLSRFVDASEAGVSARLRDFRKPEWGSHTVKRTKLGSGSIWCYRLIPNGPLLDGKRNAPTAKMEARERVTTYLADLSGSEVIDSFWYAGELHRLLASDLRELLK